ncbi:AAA family ATPase [Bradyrhizobium sp. 613_E4_N2_2]|uniref:AAA family ATPase n=1 Tax=Bradyrhizobium sp. 613_E4_N2_2 TaxID=3240371 RepID=UPI003F8BE714
MSTLNIRKAQREGARLVIGIAGISGSGKTYTALQLAYGLANNDASKVGLLDTENKRGSLYADILRDDQNNVQEFLVGDLDAPFSPQRYIDAIQAFQKAGVEVLVIDSVTHEWEGIGGCHDIAKPPGINLKMDKWNDAKAEHKRFMNVLLASNMHIIVCIRARNKVKPVKVNGKTEFEDQGVLPVQEQNFMFELTVSMMMWAGGKQRDVIKSSGVEYIFGEVGFQNGYLTPEHGQQLRTWVDGAKQLDPETEAARNSLRSITERGLEAYREAFTKLPKKLQRALVDDGSHESMKAAAEAFDKARVAAQPGGEELDELNRELSEVGE